MSPRPSIFLDLTPSVSVRWAQEDRVPAIEE